MNEPTMSGNKFDQQKTVIERLRKNVLYEMREFDITMQVLPERKARMGNRKRLALHSVLLGLAAATFAIALTLNSFAEHRLKYKVVTVPPGTSLVTFAEFTFSNKAYHSIFVPIVADMREEYNEALLQNCIWKARWVRVRGTWSFFAAMGLDRVFAFVSFFVKVWKSVN